MTVLELRRGPLTPVETATAGVMAGLAVAASAAGTILPGGAGVLRLLAAVPLAVVAVQLRMRAVVAAGVAVVLVATVVGGLSSAASSVGIVVVGVAVGRLRRARAGAAAVTLTAVVLAAGGAAFSVGLLWLLSESRQLVLDAALASAEGMARVLGRLPGMEPSAQLVSSTARSLVNNWWWWIGASNFVGALTGVLAAYGLVGHVITRLRLQPPRDPLLAALDDDARSGAEPAPLPVTLVDVGYTYPGAVAPALTGVHLTLGSEGLVVVTGPNGSGKSTLATVLAGAEPTTGTVSRPGGAGLGRAGGTAYLMQRSELQMLGETVAEDVRWGLGPGAEVDVAELLQLVGLAGLEQARTSSLSGGQLQRLALAGALARGPRLLVSDESTAMIDPAGRVEMLRILRGLSERLDVTVVHITHDPLETAAADRVIRLERGRVVSDRSSAAPEGATMDGLAATDQRAGLAPAPRWARVVLRARGVTQVYARGTPWEHTALRELSLDVRAGEGVLITGANGSGKSTLARVLTGLLVPTFGECEIADQPAWRSVGSAALSMQFARLQLRRPTVALDVLDAAHLGWPEDRELPPDHRRFVAEALALVGLAPELMDRGIDDLSGGQMRRVALAGLLTERPPVLVLDEPFAGLDSQSRTALTRLLREGVSSGLALVVISHDTAGLAEVCTRHLHLVDGSLG